MTSEDRGKGGQIDECARDCMVQGLKDKKTIVEALRYFSSHFCIDLLIVMYVLWGGGEVAVDPTTLKWICTIGSGKTAIFVVLVMMCRQPRAILKVTVPFPGC